MGDPGDFETSEYNFTEGLPFLGASSAYAAGATGQGITIAVIDTSFDPDHPDLVGRILSTSFDINADTRAADDIDNEGHGTLVAGVIAANKNDLAGHGIAFESDILAIRADRPGSCQETGEDAGCRFPDQDLADAIDAAIDRGVRIINLSLGGTPDTNPILEDAVRRAAAAGILVVISAGNDAEPAGSDPDTGDPIAATGTSLNEPANVAGTSGTFGRVVAVGSVDLNGIISDFSNRAGDGSEPGSDPNNKNFYILAPGEGVVTTGPDDDIFFPDLPTCGPGEVNGCNDTDDEGDYYIVSGTSFAAPYVSGALALMLDLFPNMTPEDALSALLESADDYVSTSPDLIREETAGVGVDAVSGVGTMNLAAAFAPQGTTSFTINGKAIPTGYSYAPAAGAFGDWASQPGALGELVFTDKFNRAYRFDAASNMPAGKARVADFDYRADAAAGQSHAVRQGPVTFAWHQPAFRDDPAIPYDEAPMGQFTAQYDFSGGSIEFGRGFGAKSLAPEVSLINEAGARTGFSDGGWARFSHDVGEMSFEIFSSDDEDLSVSGVGLSRIEERWGVRGQISTIRDERTALGGVIQGRFGGEDRSQLSAYALEGAYRPMRSLRLSAGVEAATVDLPGVETSNVWTSRWSVGADTVTAFGQLGLTVAQPRRAEGGTFDFVGVTGLDEDFNFVSETIRAPLSPSGREINYEASWGFGLPGGVDAGLTATLSTQPNHVANADPASVYWFSLSKSW